jgi:phage shock protein A
MKPIKKYNEGGELPLNRKRVESIKRRAEKAFEAGDMEAAKRLAAKADKIEKRLDARSKRVADFVAEQQRREVEHAKARSKTGSGMDQLLKDLKAEQDRQLRASGNVVIQKSGSGSSPSEKYQGSTGKGSK